MNESPFKRYFIYNGTSMLEKDVPFCKMYACARKAHGPCVKCNTPICYQHECHATRQRICHYCRLIDWVQTQKG
jgi:hypothetical protein